MVYVVGSGPAGVSVAHALLQRGADVTMLDVGLELEPDRARAVETLARCPPDQWPVAARSALQWNPEVDARSVPLKLAYGSDFPYRAVGGGLPVRQSGVTVTSSCARGGLSNLWGGAVLPYRHEDMGDWPIRLDDLAPHYRAVFEYMPLAARQDDLEEAWPLYAPRRLSLNPSRQAGALLRDLDAVRGALSREGIRYGQARLALQADPVGDQGGCVYCGMCLHGCPRKLIYNSAASLEALLTRPRFRYSGDVVVDRVVGNGEEVRLLCRHPSSRQPFTLRGERVYLAAGVLGTAKIILASVAAHGQCLMIRDCQYFLLPLLRFRGIAGVSGELLHTLAQVFLEISACIPEGNPSHLQIYTYNDLYRRALGKRLGPIASVAGALVDPLLGRLLAVQGYLHSNDSSAISIRLERQADADELVLEAVINPRARAHVDGIVRKLFRCRRYLRAMPLFPLLQLGQPGEGSHIGGTFPMRRIPGELETDILGRVAGMPRVHLVDASVFPSIPAATITLSVMANAHRIGSTYARESRAA